MNYSHSFSLCILDFRFSALLQVFPEEETLVWIILFFIFISSTLANVMWRVLVVLTCLWVVGTAQPHKKIPILHPASLRLLDNYDPIIFFHVPKTGGTSLRDVIERYCIKANISMQVHYDSINTFDPDRMPRVIYGHNTFFPTFHQTYLVPKNRSYIYISLIRHPKQIETSRPLFDAFPTFWVAINGK